MAVPIVPGILNVDVTGDLVAIGQCRPATKSATLVVLADCTMDIVATPSILVDEPLMVAPPMMAAQGFIATITAAELLIPSPMAAAADATALTMITIFAPDIRCL